MFTLFFVSVSYCPDSIVTVVRLSAGQCRIQFQVGSRNFSLLHNFQFGYGAHPVCYLIHYWGSCLPGEVWLGHKADHSFPFSAEAENEQSCIPTPPLCLDHMYRDNFTFLFVSLRYIGW